MCIFSRHALAPVNRLIGNEVATQARTLRARARDTETKITNVIVRAESRKRLLYIAAHSTLIIPRAGISPALRLGADIRGKYFASAARLARNARFRAQVFYANTLRPRARAAAARDRPSTDQLPMQTGASRNSSLNLYIAAILLPLKAEQKKKIRSAYPARALQPADTQRRARL